jgi:protein-disulfide isomerase-like protein with CxxC motif
VVQLLKRNVEEPGAQQLACDDMTVHLTYYTDPLCSWSWAFEPVRKRVADAYSGSVEWTVCMGGFLPDWSSLRDPLNAVQTPAQLAPLWFHVGRVTGVRIDPTYGTRMRQRLHTRHVSPSKLQRCRALTQARAT